MKSTHISKPKVALVYGVVVFIMTSLVVRLVDTQLLQGTVFADLANKNRMYFVRDPEQRGVFLDRYGEPLVFNKPVYYKLESAESLYSEQTRITREEALEVMSQDPELIRIEHEREYRYPQSLAHVLGYIGSVTVGDLFDDSSLHISDKIGKMGLELSYQNFLRGVKGFRKFEINALGVKQHLVEQSDGESGQSVPTTLDPYLAEVSLAAMGDKRGSVVIIDAQNGEVLSLVSTPTFDVTYLSESTGTTEGERSRVQTIQSFFSHPQKLFFNRAVSGAYPPGSVFKLITALAGLENEKITPQTTVIDEGVLEVGEYSYANWYYTQHGRTEGEINLQRSIARSNDIYFYKVAEWVGPEKIKEMAEMFGLGAQTNIQLQAESAGIIPDPEWKQQVIGERWFLGNTYHFGIGQGDLLVTPIQTAQMVQAIANKGTLCAPTLIKDSFTQGVLKRDRCGEVGVLQENLNHVVSGMLDACSTGGTGFPFFQHNQNYRDSELEPYEEIDRGAVACKTGTSEFGGADNRGYRKTHGWFVMTVGTKPFIEQLVKNYQSAESTLDEVENEATESGALQREQSQKDSWIQNVAEHGFPEKIAIVVLVESDEVNQFREGSKDAGPVAKSIFDWMFSDIELEEALQRDIVAPEYATE